MRTQGEKGHLHASERSVNTLVSNFQPPKLGDNKYFPFKLPHCGICYGGPSKPGELLLLKREQTDLFQELRTLCTEADSKIYGIFIYDS